LCYYAVPVVRRVRFACLTVFVLHRWTTLSTCRTTLRSTAS
jgi:hypothetical protein